MIKLVPIDAVQASEYNPRRNDEKRLALTELSLRKLGFLLPIYADESGEILSGHQRHLVASRMGFRQIPVEYVSGKTLGERRPGTSCSTGPRMTSRSKTPAPSSDAASMKWTSRP